ncbi:hypothetical protein ACFL2G_05425, partial [Candidatus Omnitrophota bacterium]
MLKDIELLCYDEATGDFTKKVVASEWLDSFGVKDVNHINVDNQAYPFMNKLWTGMHILTRDQAVEKKERKAHSTVFMVEKRSKKENLGNRFVDGDGQKQLIDYKDFRATMKFRNTDLTLAEVCGWGNASLVKHNRESLDDTQSPPFIQESPKPDQKYEKGTVTGTQRLKYESSALDKPVSSNSITVGAHLETDTVGTSRDEVFVEVKSPEDLIKARETVSSNWKKAINAALSDMRFPENTAVELPQIAKPDFMPAETLAEKLKAINFSDQVEEGYGILVNNDFDSLAKVPLEDLYDQEGEFVGFTPEQWEQKFQTYKIKLRLYDKNAFLSIIFLGGIWEVDLFDQAL